MTQRLKTIILAALLCFGFTNFASGIASAAPLDQVKQGADSVKNADDSGNLTELVKNIINTLLFITGMVAVIMIVIGGLRYVTSNGDSNQASQAKNTILYAVIGLVVAIMAYAIVNFVITSLG